MSRIGVMLESLEQRRFLANGLSAQYFDNKDFTNLKLSRVDAQVNFNWGSGSPVSSIAADTFSARWTGQVKPSQGGSYTFHTTSDDGVRLWIDNKLVIDKLVNHAAITYSTAPIALTAGKAVNIRLDYYDNTGNAAVKLMWSSATLAKQVIPSANLIATTATPAPTVSWKSAASSPVVRAEAAGAVVNGKLYILGGYYSTDTAIIAQKRCDVYDPATNKWTRLGDMPIAFTHAGVAVEGSNIWLVGHYTGNHPGPGSAEVWKYNTASDTWSRGPDLPVARGAGAAAIVGRNLHYFGGMDATRTQEQGEHWVLNLDNQSAGWVQKASMPNPRNHLGGAALNGKVYAIGGQHGQEGEQDAQSEVDCYDSATNKWTKVASLPAPRSHLSGSVFTMNGKILVLGGETAFKTQTSTIYSYDPATNKWSTIGSLPARRSTAITGMISTNKLILSCGNGEDARKETWIGTLV
jgi:N-acetylneuraminic acid mutarotase